MPYITIKLMEGRSKVMKEKLMTNITHVVATTLEVGMEDIRVELDELKEGNFAIGGQIAKKVNK